ncbi:DUF4340 domain-containing protein [bacterium]|nr:MAG: DUF4340 domain-containing protein [bacterium]
MKKAVTLIIILVVLLAVYWMIESEKPVVSTDQQFITADSASITKLEIHSAKNDVTLTKQGGGWMVDGEKPYPANERTLGLALAKFNQMSKKALISERPERFADMEVDDSLGVKVTVHAGDKSSTLILGKAGPTFQTSYARLDGSNEIWEVSGNNRSTFDKKLDDWRDKTINQYEMADFKKYVLNYPDHSFTAELQDSVWHITAGSRAFDGDARLIERLSRMMSRMNAVEFADTLAEDTFDDPDFQIIADLVSGETIDIKLKKFDEDRFFLRKAGAVSDFVIYKATAEAMMKQPDDFVKKEEEQK